MSKKDIAFSTLGILVTLLFAWLLYRREKADAKQAAAASARAADVPTGVYQSAYASYDGGLSQLIPGSSSTSLDTSHDGTTDTTASAGSTAPANSESLLSQVISSYTSNIPQPPTPGLIPAISTPANLTLASVPTTADQFFPSTQNTSPARPVSTYGVIQTAS